MVGRGVVISLGGTGGVLVPLGNRTDTYRHGVLIFLLPHLAIENWPGGRTGGGLWTPARASVRRRGAWGAEEPAKIGGVSGPGLAR